METYKKTKVVSKRSVEEAKDRYMAGEPFAVNNPLDIDNIEITLTGAGLARVLEWKRRHPEYGKRIAVIEPTNFEINLKVKDHCSKVRSIKGKEHVDIKILAEEKTKEEKIIIEGLKSCKKEVDRASNSSNEFVSEGIYEKNKYASASGKEKRESIEKGKEYDVKTIKTGDKVKNESFEEGAKSEQEAIKIGNKSKGKFTRVEGTNFVENEEIEEEGFDKIKEEFYS